MVDIVRLDTRGLRGRRGLSSGPLGADSVGEDEVNGAEGVAIRDKIGAAAKSFVQSGTGAASRTVDNKLHDVISVMDFGAIGNGTTDDTTALNNAIAAAAIGGEVLLPIGKKFKTTGLVNTRGIRLTGGGQVLYNPGAGPYQLNDYARSMGFVVGREYRYRLFSRLNSAGTTLKGFVYGDSTVATSGGGGGYAGSSGTPDVLLAKQLARSNVRNAINLTNRGAGGTSWSDLDALGDLSSTTDLIVIKYSVNHAGADVAAEIAAMRSKLAAIRAATYGRVDLLTIVLVGPNSTHDLAGGRTTAFAELLRQGYEQAARDFRCMYVDVYGLFQDSSWMATYYMDNPAVHPAALLQMQIWAHVGNALMAPNENQLNVNDDWINLSYQNSWANYGVGTDPASVCITPDGWAHLRGGITRSSGTPTAAQVMAVLPNTNYYPTGSKFVDALTFDGTTWTRVPLNIAVDGTIAPRDASAKNTLVCLDNISWRVR